jgi:Family of unknown function (DUF6134)
MVRGSCVLSHVVLCAAFLAPAWSVARAADAETRDFNVYVDGKRAGYATMAITQVDDGTTTVAADSEVAVKVLGLAAYKYSYRGKEIWKDGKLQKFESTCDDDGKRFVVTAAAEGNGVRVRVNNQERIVSSEVWLSSYWNRPDNKVLNQTIPIVDADTGRDLDAKVTYVGQEQLKLAGQVQNVLHYKLIGKANVDLWYDASNRLVRQEWVEDGHKTLLELGKLRK